MSTSHPILIADVLRLRTFAHAALIALVSVGLAACAGPNQKRPADDALGATPTSAATSASGAHDFDFLFGHWSVHHRILKRRPDGAPEWVEADGVVNEIPVMGGLGNVEDFFMVRDGVPYPAAALRAFDRKTHEWSIWWLDGRAPVSPIDPPVVGHFENGIGLFYADADVNGKPTRTRFTWTHASASEARWEQALSTDGGKTWTTNWTMAFHRIAQSDRTPDARPAERP